MNYLRFIAYTLFAAGLTAFGEKQSRGTLALNTSSGSFFSIAKTAP